ncbi:MAG TPA: DUF3592 domain-containing protein [Steroidobacteraceae bacterium]
MSSELFSAASFLAGMLVAMIVSVKSTVRAAQSSHEIARRGLPAQGKVLRVWRPPLMGSFVRVYFEFQPEGWARVVQCCHIDRRSGAEPVASLPAVGASVGIRYLPERPARAVIARMVGCRNG